MRKTHHYVRAYRQGGSRIGNAIALIVCIAMPLVVGLISSWISGDIPGIYATLAKPFTPPVWLFGVVWPTLYVLMGIALYLVYRTEAMSNAKILALTLFVVQMALNFAWSPVFFAARAYVASVFVMIGLIIAVVLTMLVFRSIRKAAGYLLIPYLVWLGIATCLNIGVAAIN